MAREIVVVPYDKMWKKLYEEEKEIFIFLNNINIIFKVTLLDRIILFIRI